MAFDICRGDRLHGGDQRSGLVRLIWPAQDSISTMRFYVQVIVRSIRILLLDPLGPGGVNDLTKDQDINNFGMDERHGERDNSREW